MIAQARREPASKIPRLDEPPAGWHVLTVVRTRSRSWEWCALMIDTPLDDFRRRRLLALDVRECWVEIPGKHRNVDAAWEAFEVMTAIRH
jgi:hypothetical protein